MTTEQIQQEWAADPIRLGNDFLDDHSKKRGKSIEQTTFHLGRGRWQARRVVVGRW